MLFSQDFLCRQWKPITLEILYERKHEKTKQTLKMLFVHRKKDFVFVIILLCFVVINSIVGVVP